MSLLPKEIIGPELAAGTLRVLPSRPAIPRFPMFISYRRDAPPARLRRFVERVRASVADRDCARPAAARRAHGCDSIRKTYRVRKIIQNIPYSVARR